MSSLKSSPNSPGSNSPKSSYSISISTVSSSSACSCSESKCPLALALQAALLGQGLARVRLLSLCFDFWTPAAASQGLASQLLFGDQIGKPLLGQLAGLFPHIVHAFVVQIADGNLDQIAHDRLDIATDVPNLGELGRLDLDEWRIHHLRHAPGDLGLANTGGTDHQNVARMNLLAQLVRQQTTPVTIAQCDRHRPLGVVLPNDVQIELAHDLGRCQVFDDGSRLFHRSRRGRGEVGPVSVTRSLGHYRSPLPSCGRASSVSSRLVLDLQNIAGSVASTELQRQPAYSPTRS